MTSSLINSPFKYSCFAYYNGLEYTFSKSILHHVSMLFTKISFNSVQSPKAPLPMFVTPSPNSTLFKLTQPANALLPILDKLFGNRTSVSPLQYEYLQPVNTQYFASNKSEIWS